MTLGIEESTFREVPEDIFLQWPYDKQLEYCIARDLDAVKWAMTDKDAEWFKFRANLYIQDLELFQQKMKAMNKES